MKRVCKLCIAQHGLKGSDLASWPDDDDPGADEWLNNHIEEEHHMPVRREGETEEEAQIRMLKTHPEIGSFTCKCPFCVARRALGEVW